MSPTLFPNLCPIILWSGIFLKGRWCQFKGTVCNFTRCLSIKNITKYGVRCGREVTWDQRSCCLNCLHHHWWWNLKIYKRTINKLLNNRVATYWLPPWLWRITCCLLCFPRTELEGIWFYWPTTKCNALLPWIKLWLYLALHIIGDIRISLSTPLKKYT